MGLIGLTRTAGCAVQDITYDANGSAPTRTISRPSTACGRQIAVTRWSRRPRSTMRTVSFATPNATATSRHLPGLDVAPVTSSALSPEIAALHGSRRFTRTHPAGAPAAKLSGMAAFSYTLRFDHERQASTPSGEDARRSVIRMEGALRLRPAAGTPPMPGGSRARSAPMTKAPGTFTENPFLLGLKWARGIYANNGRKKMGIGMGPRRHQPRPAWCEAANVADANGWKVGGVVYSTDPKWDVLKKICAGRLRRADPGRRHAPLPGGLRPRSASTRLPPTT